MMCSFCSSEHTAALFFPVDEVLGRATCALVYDGVFALLPVCVLAFLPGPSGLTDQHMALCMSCLDRCCLVCVLRLAEARRSSWPEGRPLVSMPPIVWP